MKKSFLKALFLLFITSKAFSQNYYYSDTVFGLDRMRCEIKVAMTYKDVFKAHLVVTNYTDSFKVIDPKNITVKSISGGTFPLVNKGLFVIPPKGTQKFRIRATDADFKNQKLEITISNIQTSGNPVNIYNCGSIELNKLAKHNAEERTFEHHITGPIDIYVKDFGHESNGDVTVKFAIKYSNPNFLGFFLKNIMLKDEQGNTFPNTRLSVHYYRKEKREVTITAMFSNPKRNSKKIFTDKLILDNVFNEYILKTKEETIKVYLNKNGEGSGNPPNSDEKEKDIEVIED